MEAFSEFQEILRAQERGVCHPHPMTVRSCHRARVVEVLITPETHASTHALQLQCLPGHTRTQTHSHTRAPHAHTPKRTHTVARRTPARVRTHKHTHAHMNVHAHAHTHTHTHFNSLQRLRTRRTVPAKSRSRLKVGRSAAPACTCARFATCLLDRIHDVYTPHEGTSSYAHTFCLHSQTYLCTHTHTRACARTHGAHPARTHTHIYT